MKRAIANIKEEMIQLRPTAEKLNSLPIVGRAMLTAEMRKVPRKEVVATISRMDNLCFSGSCCRLSVLLMLMSVCLPHMLYCYSCSICGFQLRGTDDDGALLSRQQVDEVVTETGSLNRYLQEEIFGQLLTEERYPVLAIGIFHAAFYCCQRQLQPVGPVEEMFLARDHFTITVREEGMKHGVCL